jgi:NAD+ kinase
VLVVTKLSDNSLVPVTMDVANWLLTSGLTVYIQDEVLMAYKKFSRANPKAIDGGSGSNGAILKIWSESCFPEDNIDFVITLGGDGTVLFAAWLFQKRAPPIVPFNLGSLGFLTVFDFSSLESTIQTIISNEDGMRMNFRMRFDCTIYRAMKDGKRDDDHGNSYQVLNE